MSKVLLFLAASAFLLGIQSHTQNDAILGTWNAKDLENATIKLYRSDDGFIYGKIVDCNRKDWIDKVILDKTKYNKQDQAWKGEIHSLRTGMDINITIYLQNDNKLKLVGKKFFMSRTYYWER